MMTDRRLRHVSVLLLAAAVTATGAAARASTPQPPYPRPVVGLIPFLNDAGETGAVGAVMRSVVRELTAKGFDTRLEGRLESFLKKRRLRARNALSREQARELAEEIGARYLLFGSITAYGRSKGPEVGLTARIEDPGRGLTLWSGSTTVHDASAPGLLAMRRSRTLDEATERAVADLFGTLHLRRAEGTIVPARERFLPHRSLLIEAPIFFRDPSFHERTPIRIALLPFDNQTNAYGAASVVGDRMMQWLLAMPQVEIVDPGELRQALIQEDIQPLHGLGPVELRVLGKVLGADAVVDGVVLTWENGTSLEPLLDLFARLRDTRTGRVLWSATASRRGNGARTLFDFGRVAGIDRLADRTIGELLSTWSK